MSGSATRSITGREPALSGMRKVKRGMPNCAPAANPTGALYAAWPTAGSRFSSLCCETELCTIRNVVPPDPEGHRPPGGRPGPYRLTLDKG